MFCGTIWIFAVLCGYVNSAKPNSILNRNSFTEIQVKHNILPRERMHKIIPAFKNGEARTKKVRARRGIVMVDSDFDIPSEIYTYENNLDTSGVFGKNEGSGTDELNEKESVKTTKDDTKSESEHYGTTDKTTVLIQSSTTAMEPTMTEYKNKNIAATTEAEGSGDEILLLTKEYSTTEITTKSHIKPEHDVQERIPDICMNSTCSMDDLSIFASEENYFIPEGTNFTLTCISNSSNHNMLYWYKSNGSAYFLQAFGTEEELHLNVPDIKPIQSGTYMCVKWVNKQTCCNMQSSITIYEVPFYQYHLIIIGLITLACLIICIFLSVRQSMALKIYTKQFAEKHGNVKDQLI